MKRVITSYILMSFAQKGEAGYWRGSTGCNDGAIGRRTGTVKSPQRKTRPLDGLRHRPVSRCEQTPEFFIRQAKSESLIGLATRRELSNVCVYGEG
jgi:hypothetical protein